jgi:hypothetical protein
VTGSPDAAGTAALLLLMTFNPRQLCISTPACLKGKTQYESVDRCGKNRRWWEVTYSPLVSYKGHLCLPAISMFVSKILMPNRLIIKEHFMRNVSIKTAVLKLLTILLKSTRKIKHG